ASYLPVRRIVVDDEDALAADLRREQQAFLDIALGLDLDGRREPELRAMAGLARDLDLSAHRLHQALADHQAEAGSAVAARRRCVDLRERLEESVHAVGGNADAGVLNLDAQDR